MHSQNKESTQLKTKSIYYKLKKGQPLQKLKAKVEKAKKELEKARHKQLAENVKFHVKKAHK